MRRRIVVLTVAAVMAAVMVAGPTGPALACDPETLKGCGLGGGLDEEIIIPI